MWKQNTAIISIAAAPCTMCAICISPRRYARPGTSLSSTRPEATAISPSNSSAAPEDELLAGVVAVRRLLVPAEHAAGLGNPLQVVGARNVVADVADDEDHERHREQRPGHVVQRLQRVGEPAEQRAADQRQQDELAERHHQPRDGQHDERDGHAPVRGALEVGEALDAPPGIDRIAAHRPFAPIEQSDRDGHQHAAARRRTARSTCCAPGARPHRRWQSWSRGIA